MIAQCVPHKYPARKRLVLSYLQSQGYDVIMSHLHQGPGAFLPPLG